MGVADGGLRSRLAAALPAAEVAGAAADSSVLRPEQLVTQLNTTAATSTISSTDLAPVFVIGADPALQPELAAALAQLRRPCYGLALPPSRHMTELRTAPSLAALYCAAIKGRRPAGPYVIAGVGMAAAVAYEVAVQLQGVGEDVPVLLLLEDGRLREAMDVLEQPWLRLQPFVASWRPDLDLEEYGERGRGLAQAGHGAQVQLVQSLRPEHVSQVGGGRGLVPPAGGLSCGGCLISRLATAWSQRWCSRYRYGVLPAAHHGKAAMLSTPSCSLPSCPPQEAWTAMVEEALRGAGRSGYQWQEMVATWVALYALATEPQQQVGQASTISPLLLLLLQTDCHDVLTHSTQH